ncbi:MAG TPA: hypothetical protein VHP38_15100 [Ruminiclostridium sp.]|nr:hypothetical protein [Ruminiclostridium sp.]
MSNVMDLLLKIDEKNLDIPARDIEIKRLSKAAGDRVIFTCQAVNVDKYSEIRDNSTHGDETDTIDLQIFTILEGVISPDLKSGDLRNKYNAVTPKELVKKLLRPGEISRLFDIISELSGFGDDVIDEIKN